MRNTDIITDRGGQEGGGLMGSRTFTPQIISGWFIYWLFFTQVDCVAVHCPSL